MGVTLESRIVVSFFKGHAFLGNKERGLSVACEIIVAEGTVSLMKCGVNFRRHQEMYNQNYIVGLKYLVIRELVVFTTFAFYTIQDFSSWKPSAHK